MSHTPGPWEAVRRDDQEWVINAPNGDPLLRSDMWNELATVYGQDDTPLEGAELARGNAMLIAAAPDLFKALARIEYLDRMTEEGEEVEIWVWDEAIFGARDAIMKARGW